MLTHHSCVVHNRAAAEQLLAAGGGDVICSALACNRSAAVQRRGVVALSILSARPPLPLPVRNLISVKGPDKNTEKSVEKSVPVKGPVNYLTEDAPTAGDSGVTTGVSSSTCHVHHIYM